MAWLLSIPRYHAMLNAPAICLKVTPIPGGLSNRNFRVDLTARPTDIDPSPPIFSSELLRVAGDFSFYPSSAHHPDPSLAEAPLLASLDHSSNPYRVAHLIDRRMEESIARAASSALLISPALLHYNPPLSLSQFLPGSILTPEEIRTPPVLSALLRLLTKFHAAESRPSAPATSAVASLLAEWPEAPQYRPVGRCQARAAYLRARGAEGMLPERLEEVFERAEAAVALLERSFLSRGAVMSFVHSDVTPANVIRDSQGRLWLLDFEYAALGDAWWDLGSIASLNGFSAEEIELLVQLYLQVEREESEKPDNESAVSPAVLLAHVHLMKWITDFQEAMWGYAQGAISDLSFDASWAADSSFQAYADRSFKQVLEFLDQSYPNYIQFFD